MKYLPATLLTIIILMCVGCASTPKTPRTEVISIAPIVESPSSRVVIETNNNVTRIYSQKIEQEQEN